MVVEANGGITLPDTLTVAAVQPGVAFFQGNRFLLHRLVAHVSGQIPTESTVLDLYAGAGLFAIAAATMRAARVTAVEGDRIAAVDLGVNAAASGAPVAAVHQSVEAFTTRASVGPLIRTKGRQPLVIW